MVQFGRWRDLVNSSPPTSRTGPKSPRRNSSTTSAEDFYNSFYYNEGLENKLTGAPLLGLAKYIYYLMEFKTKFEGFDANLELFLVIGNKVGRSLTILFLQN